MLRIRRLPRSFVSFGGEFRERLQLLIAESEFAAVTTRLEQFTQSATARQLITAAAALDMTREALAASDFPEPDDVDAGCVSTTTIRIKYHSHAFIARPGYPEGVMVARLHVIANYARGGPQHCAMLCYWDGAQWASPWMPPGEPGYLVVFLASRDADAQDNGLKADIETELLPTLDAVAAGTLDLS